MLPAELLLATVLLLEKGGTARSLSLLASLVAKTA